MADADSGADTSFAWVKLSSLAPQMPTGKALTRTSAIATARGNQPAAAGSVMGVWRAHARAS